MFVLAVVGTSIIVSAQELKYLFPFYAALGNLVLGLFVYLQNPKSRINISYAITAFVAVFWIIAIFLYGEAKTASEAFLWSRVAGALSAYIPLLFLYFFSVFPKEDNPPKLYPTIFGAAVASFISAIYFSPFLIRGVVKHGAGFSFVPGPVFSLFIIYFIGVMGYAFYKLIAKHYVYKGPARLQVKYVLFGFFLGTIFPVVTNLLLPLFGFSQLAWIGPFSTFFTIAFISFAITKARLMDISVIISRALAEVLVVTALGSFYLGLVWLYLAYVSTQIDLPFLVWTIVFGIFIGHYFLTIRLFVQTSSDKLFLRGKYDYYKELSEISTKVGERMSLKAILEILYRAFRDVIEISNPRIYLPENFTEPEKGGTKYVVYNKTCDINESCESLALNDPIVDQLITSRNHIMEPNNPKHELLVPCLLENRLIAIFVLGRKLSEDPYTDDDIRLLEVLANQAAMALDHTRSYERIKLDLETAEKELARSQRLASLGTLTAGVTHEIRNPLTVIRSETERLANKERDLEYLKQFRDLLLKHIDRISGIVQRMLGLAKESVKKQQEIDLNTLIEDSLRCFTFDKVTVTKELNNVPKIRGNAEELQEVFVNFIQNAIEAMPNGGALKLRTYPEHNRIVAEISDTGKGIADNIREKIFDPFFSTRHEGAGLGLSIVYRIVREHGGDIKVQSEEGKGTTFKILF
ncbi:hypothetical protein A3F86_01880 [candidate division WOR-1 bacterium RIFCSPLOWO2_12_FULL_45_9]|uniref:histidine kinase n=1 Tax=candidate division WOR-1 bacterium RIFCSPLOWO2_12_FULL_45_9 TaxID=1802568 RepID=A0A1F4RN53_UNCSA|nr:MAG: hypothetical protein A3F86_01880 [candidate division WOR-1 bacterium RIFCSPLOWO2_12_FULL_45_9]